MDGEYYGEEDLYESEDDELELEGSEGAGEHDEEEPEDDNDGTIRIHHASSPCPYSLIVSVLVCATCSSCGSHQGEVVILALDAPFHAHRCTKNTNICDCVCR